MAFSYTVNESSLITDLILFLLTSISNKKGSSLWRLGFLATFLLACSTTPCPPAIFFLYLSSMGEIDRNFSLIEAHPYLSRNACATSSLFSLCKKEIETTQENGVNENFRAKKPWWRNHSKINRTNTIIFTKPIYLSVWKFRSSFEEERSYYLSDLAEKALFLLSRCIWHYWISRIAVYFQRRLSQSAILDTLNRRGMHEIAVIIAKIGTKTCNKNDFVSSRVGSNKSLTATQICEHWLHSRLKIHKYEGSSSKYSNCPRWISFFHI